MTTNIRLSGPADVLTVLPYQLGFHPKRCLVAVSLHGTRVGLVQRIDLPPSEHVGDAVAAMIGPLRQDSPTSVLLVGFEDREGESRAMLDEMDDVCRRNGVYVDDRMVVRGGRWFDVDCDRKCCPSEGLLLPDASEVPAVAEFVGRGICPLPDRSALADLLEPSRDLSSRAVSLLADEWLNLRLEARDADRVESHGPGADVREIETGKAEKGKTEKGKTDIREADKGESELSGLESELSGFRANELAVWRRVLCDEDDADPVRGLPPQDLAILAVSLTDVDLRDALIAWLCPGTLPQDVMDRRLCAQMSECLPAPQWLERDIGDVEQVIALQRVERRLCELCAVLPDPWAVPALTLLASFTWWRGDGALTRVALDRALRVQPTYRLAQLLEKMVDLAIRPEKASA